MSCNPDPTVIFVARVVDPNIFPSIVSIILIFLQIKQVFFLIQPFSKITLFFLTSENVEFLSTFILPVLIGGYFDNDTRDDVLMEFWQATLNFACFFHPVSVKLQLALEANHDEVKIMRISFEDKVNTKDNKNEKKDEGQWMPDPPF